MATPQPLPRIQRDVIREILRQLRAAERSILAAMRGVTDADRARRLARQRAEIARSIEVFRAAAEASIHGGLDAAWAAGAAVIRDQLGATAAGVALGGRLDARLLLAMRNFLTDRLSDVGRQAIDKINTALAQHLLGVQSLADAITQIQRILGGAPRRRAMTIAYTEIGRAYSASQYEQMLDQAKVLKGLKKRWLHSQKEHGRPGHILCADATKADPIPVDEPFEIVDLKTGEIERLRYPRDPEAGPGNTINCGCMMVAVPPEDEEYAPLTDADLVKPGTVVRDGVIAAPRIVQAADGLLASLAANALISDFIAKALMPNPVKQASLALAEVPPSFANSLQALGVDTTRRNLALDHDNSRHLFKRHGTEAERLHGQIPITAQDMADLPAILAAHHSAKPGTPPKAKDGASLIEVGSTYGAYEYSIIMKIRKREIVPYTMHKRPRKK